jgi:hypothetical protein
MATTTNVYAAVPFPAGARKVNDWTDAGRPDAFRTFDCSRVRKDGIDVYVSGPGGRSPRRAHRRRAALRLSR